MRERNYKPAKQNQIANRLKLGSNDRKQLRRTLKRMRRKGIAVKTKNNRWTLPNEKNLIRGTLRVFQSGFGIVKTEENEEEIHISRRKLNGAIDGDIVLVKLLPHTRKPSRRANSRKSLRKAGAVVMVEQHGKETVPGTMVKKLGNWYLLPDNASISQNVKIDGVKLENKGHNDLKGHKVVARLTPPTPQLGVFSHLSGVVIEDIGPPDAPGVDVLSVAKQHEIADGFSSDLEESTRKLSKTVTKNDLASRRDLRELLTITIDPADARDFDDAVSLKREQNGNWRLYVHIADVAHYVPEDSPTDIEARSRGNSTYLVDRVLPMLPEHLTNDVCSLRPEVDSLTHTVEISFSPQGDVLEYETYRSVIHSDARLAYGDVQAFFDGKKDHGMRSEVARNLAEMRKIARILRAKRVEEGSLDFTMPEARCVLNKKGVCVGIDLQGGIEACRVIEEFMLAANRVVAYLLFHSGREGIYRVHDEPDEQEWNELLAELKVLGVSPLPHQFSEINYALEQMQGSGGEHAFSIRILRTMKKAMYSADSTGHFGLGFEYYTHFTSPIRRYPDLVVHRILNSIEANDNSYRPDKTKLKEIAAHCTETEIESQNAERESVDIKRLQYFKRLLNKGEVGPYRGVIVTVVQKGLLVELDDTLQAGLIPFSALKGDHFRASDDGLTAKGTHSGKIWKVGQVVDVLISKVDEEKRFVDFVLA